MSKTRRLDVVASTPHPAYVVWELTLRCDHACHHCGSRAGVAREDELSTAEALRVVDELATMGTREVVLIGGEAYLHAGFLPVVEALRACDITPTVTTGGRGVDAPLATAMRAAGVARVSVSVDGLQATHDRLRNLRGSWAAGMAALGHARAAGIAITANTNVNRLNLADLEPLYDELRGREIVAWQVQLTAPLGRAADRGQLILQPWQLLELLPRLVALKARATADGILLMPGNNVGYFGPEEATLRSLRPGAGDHWHGCQAGKFVMGIESDGAVKGCPSLQTAAYVGGNLRTAGVAAVWNGTAELAFTRRRTVDDLWGFCRRCDFAETCLGGCTFTAHALLGRAGNNPLCHYRARTLARAGRRERLVALTAAPGLPFDGGTFELVEEALEAPDPDAAVAGQALVQLRRPSPTA